MELSNIAYRAMRLQSRAKYIHNTNLKGNTKFRIVKYCIGGPPPNSNSYYDAVYLSLERLDPEHPSYGQATINLTFFIFLCLLSS